jgi:hypothetical protein
MNSIFHRPLLSLLFILTGSFFPVGKVQAAQMCGKVHATPVVDVLNLQAYVENYSDIIPAVHDLIELGLQRYSNTRPGGKCYRAVKGLLLDSGLVRKEIEGTFASSAHTKNFLVNRGFVNLLERAPFSSLIRGAYDEHIPTGAILVYEGTNGLDGTERPLGQGIGHIEIKCGPNCYLFDSVNQYPGGPGGGRIRTEGVWESGSGISRRRLIGVYILDFFSIF